MAEEGTKTGDATLERPQHLREFDGGEREHEPAHRVVARAAEGAVKADESDAIGDATEWLLEAASGDEELTHPLTVNVGSHNKPRKIRWVIRAVPGPEIRKLRERASGGNRAQRRAGIGIPDANALFEANVKLVVIGTAEPDVAGLAERAGMTAGEFLLEKAFKRKQGLIDQIAAEIMELSGYDDEDVSDAMVQAASGS